MKKIDFNDGWSYRRLEESGVGQPIVLPHDAMIAENRSINSAGGANVGWFEGYDYLYTKTFFVPAEEDGKTAIFEFEGVYHNAEVFINGEKAGFRPYGYTNFYVPAGGRLSFGGENTLEVIARNADQPNSRWYSGAGVYRPVTMWVADAAHIKLNGVKIRTLSLHPAEIEVQVEATDTALATVTISDGVQVVGRAEGICDGSMVFRILLDNVRPWSAQEPNLYTCKVAFGTDESVERFGLRTLAWGESGLLLNGERVILRGACIHHDNGILGACAFPEAEERKVRILKENGYNAIRSAHNPCSKAMLDACDRLGMLVMDEYVDCWYIHKTEHDYVDHFMDWWKQDLKDMADKDYNHPSVILYSTGNEVSETAQGRGIKLAGEMTAYLHSLDATRPVTCGINIFFNLLSSMGLGVYSDDKAKKEAETQNKKKTVGSEFYNNLAGLLGDKAMKLGATLHGCDVKTRDAFANMDIAGYNYGILRYKHDLKKYPARLILGSETFCKDAASFYKLAQKEPRLIGDFVWAGMDYLGEVGIGSWEYVDYAPQGDHGPGWISAGSGRVDLTGHPLAEADYTRVAFGLELNPVIAVRPVNHTKDKHTPSAWKLTNAIASWSWDGCAGTPAVVEVYSVGDTVTLLVNGRRVGHKRLKDCRAIFYTKYEDGEVVAISYDATGKELSSTIMKTAGRETVLQTIPETEWTPVGGLCFVRLQYTDQFGVAKPLARGKIKVTVDGGELLALGNACPYYAEPYQHDETNTYYGKALAVVRAGAGETMTFIARDGTHEGRIDINLQ